MEYKNQHRIIIAVTRNGKLYQLREKQMLWNKHTTCFDTLHKITIVGWFEMHIR